MSHPNVGALDVATIKKYLALGVIIGEAIAARTATKVDDNLVALAKQLLENEMLLSVLPTLFSGDDGVGCDCPDDCDVHAQALWSQVVARRNELQSLVEAAQILS